MYLGNFYCIFPYCINKVVQPYKPEKKGKKGLTKGRSGDIINKLSDANE